MEVQEYTAQEIMQMNLPEGALLLDQDDDLWVKYNGEYIFEDEDEVQKGLYSHLLYRLLMLAPHFDPPENLGPDYVQILVPFWVNRTKTRDGESQFNAFYHSGENVLSYGHFTGISRKSFLKRYGIDLEVAVPDTAPVWEDPSGLTLEEARELAARLKEFDKETT